MELRCERARRQESRDLGRSEMTRHPWSRTQWIGNALALIAMAIVFYGMWLSIP
jgi:hypothetical protein